MSSIKGIPEGWELVKFGVPKSGDWLINSSGEPEQSKGTFATVWPIIRKIPKSKQYRAFANAAEFKPHRDRWWKKTSGDDRTYPPCYYNDSYHGGLHFDRCFIDRTFDDGTPFGVEVEQ